MKKNIVLVVLAGPALLLSACNKPKQLPAVDRIDAYKTCLVKAINTRVDTMFPGKHAPFFVDYTKGENSKAIIGLSYQGEKVIDWDTAKLNPVVTEKGQAISAAATPNDPIPSFKRVAEQLPPAASSCPQIQFNLS